MNNLTFARPYVISWNLTYRCNLACEHCYLDAGGTSLVRTENFADRSELGTEECFRVIDDIASFAPECLTILTGGEPLLRRDILEIVRRAADRELWVVVGTNGVRISENVAAASGGGRSTGAVSFARCARSRSSRPLQEGARRLAEHGGRSRDPQPDGSPLHRADDRWLAQSRRARGDRRLRARSPRGQGLEPLLPGADRARAVRVGHQPFTVRRGPRLAVPDPEEVRPPDAREREVRSALHQDGSGACAGRERVGPGGCPPAPGRRRASRIGGRAFVARPSADQDLFRRRRRLPGGDALHGDPAEWRCHAMSLPPGLRGDASPLRASPTSGRPQRCSPTFAAAPRSAGDAGRAR